LQALILGYRNHFVTAFQMGSKWSIRDDEETLLLEIGAEYFSMNDQSVLCLYRVDIPTKEEINRIDNTFMIDGKDYRDYLNKYE
jgi:hypothetical protein